MEKALLRFGKWLILGIVTFAAMAAMAQELQIQEPEVMRANLLKLLPRSKAITQVIGNGRGELFLFVDPLDEASQKLVRAVQDLPNATIRYYPAPNGALDSFDLALRIRCARNPAQTLLDVMVADQEPPDLPRSCNPAILADIMLTVNDKIMRVRPGFLTARGLGTGVPSTEELASALFPFAPPRGAKITRACGRYNEEGVPDCGR